MISVKKYIYIFFFIEYAVDFITILEEDFPAF